MRRQITAMALSLALCGSLLSATALAAETPSGAADAAMAAAGVKDGQTVTQKELYAADPEGTVSFANLEARVRENNLTIRMLEESIASIDVVDYEKMYDELKDGLNEIAKIQRTMLQLGQLDSAMGNTSLSGSFSSEYIFSNLDASYDSLRETFDDLKDGKIQDDYAAAKRQLENAENQVVMGAETLYMAILEMQNTRASLQRQLDALDRTVEEMELRYKLGQISALTPAAGEERPHPVGQRHCHPGHEHPQLHPPAGGHAGPGADRQPDADGTSPGIRQAGGRDGL